MENGRNSISNSPKTPLANYLNELLLLPKVNVKGHMHQGSKNPISIKLSKYGSHTLFNSISNRKRKNKTENNFG